MRYARFFARPDFFYFLVLGSADPIFSKTGIKIKLLSLNFIFFIAADRNFPPHSEIKYRTFFAGELCAGTEIKMKRLESPPSGHCMIVARVPVAPPTIRRHTVSKTKPVL